MGFGKKNIKAAALRFIGYLMYFSGAYFVLDELFRNKGIYILMYHKIAEKDDSCYYQDIAVKSEELARQLKYFSRKYCFISMSEAVSIIRDKGAIDKDYIVFTFDDGYSDNNKNGIDIFKQYRIRPIVYLTAKKIEDRKPIWTETVDYIVAQYNEPSFEAEIGGNRITGKPYNRKGQADLAVKIKKILVNMATDKIDACLEALSAKVPLDMDSIKSELLDWDNIKELLNSGWEAGSHTMNHVNLAVESEAAVTYELCASGELIENRLDCSVEDFAYPYGKENHYNNFVVESVKKCYRSAVTTTEGMNQCKDDLYHLRRIMVANHHSLMDIRIKLLKVKITDFFRKRGDQNKNSKCK